LVGDTAVGIETTEGAIAFLKDTTSFFNKRLDVVNKFFFVKFIARCSISLFNKLGLY
jgi:hypothetical protein